jgi:hypothetical protein
VFGWFCLVFGHPELESDSEGQNRQKETSQSVQAI